MDELIPSKNNEQKIEKVEAEDFVELVEKQNPRLFNGLNKDKQKELRKAISLSFTQIQTSHSGPLPDPQTLEGYSKLIDNGAERIMVMAEKEQVFRHRLTDKLSTSQSTQFGRGQIFGFILGLSGIGGGIFLAYLGKETAGLVSIITSVTALAGAFIIGKVASKNKD